MATATQERLKQVSVSEEVWRRVKVAAAQEGISVRELAERALRKELDSKPPKPR